MTEDIQKRYTYVIVEPRAFPAVLTSFLWLMGSYDRPMIFTPQHYGTYSILVIQARGELNRLTNSYYPSFTIPLCKLFLLPILSHSCSYVIKFV